MLKIVFVSAVVLLGIIQNIEGGIPPEMKDAAAALHAACVTETGVSEDAIQAAGSGTFANDQALKCYMKCTWEKMGVIDAAGNVDSEHMLSILPPDFSSKVADVVRKCGTQVGADACDNAFLTNKCYYDNDPANYFIV